MNITMRPRENVERVVTPDMQTAKSVFIGATLVVALLAFEIFNFDTTRYALQNLLGDVRFLNMQWAAILAIAFCAIDFAGLARLFTPERGEDEPREVWYLMGAWLLGATMNAVMTWWAVSVTLLTHDFGNEVLSREQLLRYVPVFVAVLVWLTRILFIGALSIAGDHLMELGRSMQREARQPAYQPVAEPVSARPVGAAESARQSATLRPSDAGSPRRRAAAQQTLVYQVDAEPTIYDESGQYRTAVEKAARQATPLNAPPTVNRPRPNGRPAGPPVRAPRPGIIPAAAQGRDGIES